MNEDQMRLLREFLGERWALWEEHCETCGEPEQAEEIYQSLGGE